MGAKSGLVTGATGLEAVASAAVHTIQKTHEFRRTVPMVERWAECVIRHIPSWAENQKVHQRMMWCL
jgi:hypothetical protein